MNEPRTRFSRCPEAVTKDVFIRPATTEDFDQLLNLFDEVAAEGRWIGTEPGFDRSAYRAGWDRIIDGNGGALFVATDGETIMGTLTVDADSAICLAVGHVWRPWSRRGIVHFTVRRIS